MVRFEQQLAHEVVEKFRDEDDPYLPGGAAGVELKWAEGFLDYGALKRELKALRVAYDDDIRSQETQHHDSGNGIIGIARRASMGSLGHHISGEEVEFKEDSFSRRLDAEVEKAVLFFLVRQGEIADRLLELRKEAPSFRDMFPSQGRGRSLEELQMAYKDIAREVVKLLHFLRLNITGLRKVLKKHDKQIREKMLAQHYLASRARKQYSFLQQLIHNEGILALIGSLKRATEEVEMRSAGYQRTASGAIPLEFLLENGDAGITGIDPIFQEIDSAMILLQESQRRTVNDYLITGDMEMIMAMEALEDMTDAEVEAMSKRKLDVFSAYINLAYTFVYMVNYYVVAPTATEYSEALGGSPAVSGLIIGMTPIAACFSCALYSWWTNKSFKAPLLLCCVLLVVGNAMYGLALSYSSFALLLAGRLLVGLGGARGVNRRYIADTVPIEQRTFFSAAFVAAGSLGMAAGPAFSAAINNIDLSVGIVIINGLTAPGWFMFIAWAILLVLTVFYFNEPQDRFIPLPRTRANSDETDRSTPATKVFKKYTSAASVSEEGRSLLREAVLPHSMKSPPDGCCGIPLTLMFCLGAYFVNKLVTEAAVSSAPLLTQYLFGWTVTDVGMFMAVLGLATVPITVLVGKMGDYFQDRQLLLFITFLAVISCYIICNLMPYPYSVYQYVLGASAIFITLQAHESVTMSITSKIIPAHLAKGTFNSGFLATEAGTSARFVGDVAITFLGLVSIEDAVNVLFVPCLILLGCLIIGTQAFSVYLDV